MLNLFYDRKQNSWAIGLAKGVIEELYNNLPGREVFLV